MTRVPWRMSFVWPNGQSVASLAADAHLSPLDEAVSDATVIFGGLSTLTSRGLEQIERWIQMQEALKVALLLFVRPSCGIRASELSRAAKMCDRLTGRLALRVLSSSDFTPRTSYLCFSDSRNGSTTVASGSVEDLWPIRPGDNRDLMVFRADMALTVELQRSFESDWIRAADVRGPGVAQIPALILPSGREEGTRLWRDYESVVSAASSPPVAVGAASTPTDGVTYAGDSTAAPTSVTASLGLTTPDDLACEIAALYGRGRMVTIEKLSRRPPLDAPLDPQLFGDLPETRTGSVTRRVSMRISIISDRHLKRLEGLRTGIRTLLGRFSFALAENVRWVPSEAKPLFDEALTKLDEKGVRALKDVIGGNLDSFMASRREQLREDIAAMCAELGQKAQRSRAGPSAEGGGFVAQAHPRCPRNEHPSAALVLFRRIRNCCGRSCKPVGAGGNAPVRHGDLHAQGVDRPSVLSRNSG